MTFFEGVLITVFVFSISALLLAVSYFIVKVANE